MNKFLKIWIPVFLCVIFTSLFLTSCHTVHVHQYGEWITLKEATCSQKGIQIRYCYCLDKDTREIEEAEHTPNAFTSCERSQRCSVCDAVLRQATEHAYGDWVFTAPATCTERGSKVQTCTVCGDTERKTVEATGHMYGDFVTVREATCAEPGLRERVCEKCGDKVSNTVIVEHTGEWLILKEPTKTEDGSREIDCASCHRKITETLYAHGSSGLTYWLDVSNKICKITGIGTCTDSDVFIPEYIEGYPVTTIGNGAFKDCKTMTSLSIPGTVTKIGSDIVSGADNLTTLYYHSSYKCDFFNFGIYSIKKIVYGGTYVGTIAMTVEEVVITGKPTYIDDGAFANSALKSFVIPESVTSIGNSAFRDCRFLTEVVIPESVTSIGYSAFENCSSLTNVTIPSSVASIGRAAFSACRCLTEIVIPEGMTELENMLFFACESLTKVVIPSSVTKIDGSAFSGCDSLSEITLPEGLTQIGEGAFSGCNTLTAFTLPDGITEIPNYMFRYCEALTDVVIPENVTKIGADAFSRCTNLQNITFKGTKDEWKAIAKGDDWKMWSGLKTVTCSDGTVNVH